MNWPPTYDRFFVENDPLEEPKVTTGNEAPAVGVYPPVVVAERVVPARETLPGRLSVPKPVAEATGKDHTGDPLCTNNAKLIVPLAACRMPVLLNVPYAVQQPLVRNAEVPTPALFFTVPALLNVAGPPLQQPSMVAPSLWMSKIAPG